MNQTVENLLLKLNESQLKPVLDTEGPVLVIAGAGSGKTRVLTSRIAYLVLENGVSPSEILAITFTNKAAKEMKDRLYNFIPDVDRMWCSTIHSMCVKILRSCIERLGYTRNFTIYDETDKDKVVKRICDSIGLPADKHAKPIKNYISEAKNRYQTPEEFFKDNPYIRNGELYLKALLEYERLLFESNALDFDDILVKTVKVFLDYPEVAEYYSKKFRYVHVDEFQDTNRVQFLIVKILAKYHGNLFAVGDDDQSIYGWRGADLSNILDFDEIFKGTKVYKLEQNYRSTKRILSLANKVIGKNKERRDKVLWTENGDGADVVYYDAPDDRTEASYVAVQIKKLMNGYNYKYKDFAVLMRLNALSRGYEQEFLKYNIPYKIYGGFRFYERKEIKDLLGYIKLINNTKDNESFIRIVNCPKRGIGEKSVNALLMSSAEKGKSMFDCLADIETDPAIGGAAKNKFIELRKLLYSLQAKSEELELDEFIKAVVDDTRFLSMFSEDTEENENRKMNIDEFISSAVQFKQDNPEAMISDFVNSVTLSSDTDDINSDDVVSIATIHAVKGLEFKVVFIVGLEEGIFPISRASEDCEQEEERRLMYVSITRAMERLYMSRADSRFLHGERTITSASRFLKDCGVISERTIKKPEPESYSSYGGNSYGSRYNSYNSGNGYNKSDYSGRKDYNERNGADDIPDTSSYGGFNSGYYQRKIEQEKAEKTRQNSIDYTKFRPGAKVKHVNFGEGTIITVQGVGASMVADIAFKGYGVKKLAVKCAPIQIIG